ncbi:NAD-dependent epimerase/dehydratase family protein [Exiguobacterium sp. Helios]|uniref:NAD-dependent epimerase/dehydratase family protein n=1 Tax=Exiguobacterium sp. Helios TaxID=2735868 RepID=UPI00165D31CF|nr:NAD-dependent epimerase/dehydratase family protein [Exiguobacterium sp. Helios]QNR22170.1 NAD-dependent epimerase/dehydratase family protein [Exiguobacterium sp. Helios]
MKKVLVTGENGYIGTAFYNWIKLNSIDIDMDFINVRTNEWKEKSFSNYDVVLHLAGIAHSSRNPKLKEKYYKVNRDLTLELAKKSRRDSVKQFIFMSSIIVYGEGNLNDPKIDESTVPVPSNFYGDSKLQAENLIRSLENDSFKIAIIRPPMIYGRNSKGNYSKLSKLSKLTPVFPDFYNERSMLHIDNLSSFITAIILKDVKGTFFPQNKSYVTTSELVKTIAEVNDKKVILVPGFNYLIKKLIKKQEIFNKLFGNLVYDQKLSEHQILNDYWVNDFYESIVKTERDIP